MALMERDRQRECGNRKNRVLLFVRVKTAMWCGVRERERERGAIISVCLGYSGSNV